MVVLATDCSGVEAPSVALRMMRLPVKLLWASDNDELAKRVLLARHSPQKFFDDVTKRKVSELPRGSPDLYVAGFPCQHNSRIGFPGSEGMSNGKTLKVLRSCLAAIQSSRPKVFVLENVPFLLVRNGGKDGRRVLKLISRYAPDYHLSTHVLNSADFGSLQSRKRLFYVGVRDDCADGPLEEVAPKRYRPMLLSLNRGRRQSQDPELSPRQARLVRANQGVAGCLLDLVSFYGRDTRCLGGNRVGTMVRSSNLFDVNRNRFVTVPEIVSLQNFPPSYLNGLVDDPREAQRLMGNSMDTASLRAVFSSALKHAGVL